MSLSFSPDSQESNVLTEFEKVGYQFDLTVVFVFIITVNIKINILINIECYIQMAIFMYNKKTL